MIYRVIRKSDGEEVTRYAAMSVVDGDWPLTYFDHVEMPEDAPPVVTPSARAMTKLEYLRRFTQDERIAIRSAATQSAVLADYLELLTEAEEVRTDDPDIIAALGMLEQAGLLAAGRAIEVLNG